MSQVMTILLNMRCQNLKLRSLLPTFTTANIHIQYQNLTCYKLKTLFIRTPAQQADMPP